ncbi:PI-PLC X domain-containing protein [Platanthera guangdongensis]|uniref:PI-PLC X domain-containing protein n=1 Tax=Platanthera guangdongensis TaxID=2320717 RepID=A0ABR2N4Y6_9ASPA
MPGLLFLQLLLSILLRLTIFSNAAKVCIIISLFSPASGFPLMEILQVGDGCLADRDCGAGLHCDACGSRCSRITPIDPKTIVSVPSFTGKELPFNKYSWLTTHNSYALAGAKSATGSDLITFTNQQDTVTSQLKPATTAASSSAASPLQPITATSHLSSILRPLRRSPKTSSRERQAPRQPLLSRRNSHHAHLLALRRPQETPPAIKEAIRALLEGSRLRSIASSGAIPGRINRKKRQVDLKYPASSSRCSNQLQ